MKNKRPRFCFIVVYHQRQWLHPPHPAPAHIVVCLVSDHRLCSRVYKVNDVSTLIPGHAIGKVYLLGLHNLLERVAAGCQAVHPPALALAPLVAHAPEQDPALRADLAVVEAKAFVLVVGWNGGHCASDSAISHVDLEHIPARGHQDEVRVRRGKHRRARFIERDPKVILMARAITQHLVRVDVLQKKETRAEVLQRI